MEATRLSERRLSDGYDNPSSWVIQQIAFGLAICNDFSS